MQFKIHVPRLSEAEVQPRMKDDLIVTPRVYRKTGRMPALYVTSTDDNGHVYEYVVYQNASDATLSISQMTLVTPKCDTRPKEVASASI